jgi:signal transduction histidine kinase
MKQLLIALFTLVVMGASTVWADDSRGTTGEAQKLVADAIAFFDDVGAEAAFAEMNSGESRFEDRDLYIFVVAQDGTVVAQVADPGRVGMDARTLRDAADTAYGTMIVDHATPDGVWIEYLREDPLTGEVAPKASWVVLHDGYIFGCGVYLTQ